MPRPSGSLDEWVKKKMGLGPGEELTRDKITAYQLRRLAAVVDYARRHSPFYRRHLAHGPEDGFESPEDLSRLPFATEEDLRTAGLQMLCVSQSRIQRVVTLATSGTTGHPKRVFFTPADQTLTVEFFRQGLATFTEPGEKALILLPGERPGSLGDLLGRALREVGVEPVPFGVGHPLAAMLARLVETQAQVIIGIPVHLLALARYHRHCGPEQPVQARKVLLSTDYVSQAVVEVLQETWQCEVFRYYGMTEMGYGGGIECRRHEGYHLYEGDFLVEIVDPVTGTRLPEGEWGEVVVTTLTREGMPLIRYRTGDFARLLPDPCPCGSVLARLDTIKRRVKGWTSVAKGTGFSIGELDEILFPQPGVVDFTVTQTRLAPLSLVVEVMTLEPGLDPARLREALRRHPALALLPDRDGLQLEVQEIPDPAAYQPRLGKRRMEVRGTGA